MTDENSPSPNERIRQMTTRAMDRATSRRTFLAGTVAAGAGVAGLSGPTAAGTTQEENESQGSGGGNGSDQPSNVDVLNYALTLEHLENVFYRQGLEQFDDSQLRNAEVLCQRNQKLNEDVPTRLRAIGEHEAAHVETITQVVEDLGGDPVEEACYDFGYETPSEFLGVAKALENTGVTAYDGAIHFFDDDKLATAGATIATVEARHASFLNTLNGEDPFPAAFDEARSMEKVEEVAGQFIVECE